MGWLKRKTTKKDNQYYHRVFGNLPGTIMYFHPERFPDFIRRLSSLGINYHIL
jgi:transcriptional regulator of NAD metabolism